MVSVLIPKTSINFNYKFIKKGQKGVGGSTQVTQLDSFHTRTKSYPDQAILPPLTNTQCLHEGNC